jgi:hypothetical protein
VAVARHGGHAHQARHDLVVAGGGGGGAHRVTTLSNSLRGV